MDNQHQAWLVGGAPLQHLLIAVGVAECSNRFSADELVDANRFARSVVNEIDFRHTLDNGLAVADFESLLRRTADDLFWRDAVSFLRPRPHELNATTGNDERFEAIDAHIVQQLEHGLIDAL